jgi:hypothetical protein
VAASDARRRRAVDLFLGVREDACPADQGKLFPGVCGCGTPDDDPDRDGMPGCLDACPGDASKTSPGSCGCGTGNGDGDADGTPDCHDPAGSAALRLLVQEIIAKARRLTTRAADRDALTAELRTAATWLVAAGKTPRSRASSGSSSGPPRRRSPVSPLREGRPSPASAPGRSPSSESC